VSARRSPNAPAGLRHPAGRSAPIFLQFLQIERLVFRIPIKAAIDGMARVANRDLPNPKIGQEIDQGRKCQCSHRHQRLAAREEVNAGGYPEPHNGKSNSAVEIFLDIQSVMTAGYTCSDDALVQNGVVHE
jgi:hypothetical protein